MTGIARGPVGPTRAVRGAGRIRSDINRRGNAMRYLYTMIAALGLLLLGTVPASADHAPEWSANGDSFVVDATTVHLEGVDTSIETAALNLNVDSGVTISFDYELHGDAKCEAGEPRVFAFVNGINNKSEHCDGEGSDETSGTVEYQTTNAGLITQVGLVYSPGVEDAGHVIIRNLTIGGEPVHFLNPEPEPEPTETSEPTEEPTSDPTTEPTSEPSAEPTDDETAPATGDDTTPASSQETLPDTGVSLLWLVGGGLALVLGGYALLRRGRTE